MKSYEARKLERAVIEREARKLRRCTTSWEAKKHENLPLAGRRAS